MLKKILKNNYLIILILFAVFVKELIFVMVIPLWQNHDESEHFAYTAYLVEEKKLPVYQGGFENHMDLTVSEEIKKADELLENSKISYGVFRRQQLIHQDFSRALSYDQAKLQLTNLNRRVTDTEYKNAAILYSPLYYALEAIPYLIFYKDTIIARAFAMRIFGIIFLLVTVFFSYKLARHILKSKLGAATAAILIGFLPRFSYTAAGINNDALLIALSTILFYLLIKYHQEQLTFKKSILLGLTIGLGLLSKSQFIVFTPLVAGFFIYKFIKKEEVKYLIQSIITVLFITLLVAGWWYIFNYLHYHHLLGVQSASGNQLTTPIRSLATTFFYIILRYFYMFESYFFSFGCCNEIVMAPFYQMLFGISVGIGFVGILIYFLLHRQRDNLIQIIILILSAFLLEGSYLFIFIKGMLSTGSTGFPLDGRYLYPVIAPLTILFIIGWRSIIPKKLYKITYLIIIIGIIFINIVSLIYNIIPRFYL